MKTLISNFSLALAFVGLIAPACGQTVKYEFTGGSMLPTVSGMPAGVTASNFLLGTFTLASLQDNGGSGNSLRISRGDVGTASGTALGGAFLSFSLMIPAGTTLDLSSLALDYTSGGLAGTEFINSRVFSNLTANNAANVVVNTIGVLGRSSNGVDSATGSISLATPDLNPTNGSAVNNGMFNNLTNQTVIFSLPFIRDDATTPITDYLDIDNITLTFNTATPAEGITNFNATATTSPTAVLLGWNENLGNETGFVIERSITGSGSWAALTTTAANATSFNDASVVVGSAYTYRIAATFSGGGVSPTVTSASVSVPVVTDPISLILMPLGDSITQGSGAAGGYRDPLLTTLTNHGFPIQYVGSASDNATSLLTSAGQTHHEGHGGYPTTLVTANLDGLSGSTANGGYWLTGVGGRAAVFPDIILLLIGTNDLGMYLRSPAEVYTYYDLLLTKLVTLRPNARIICSTILPYNGDPYPPGKDYSQREANNLAFSQMLPGLVASYQANGHCVRVYDMRQKINPANASALLTSDGVHPNLAGYNAIASGWFEALQQLPLGQSWRMLHFGSAAVTSESSDLADPDGDGTANLLEYAFGTDPLAASAAQPLTVTKASDAGIDYPAITFARRKNADVRYVVEISPDLAPASWSADALQVGPPVSLGPDFEQVTYRDRVPSSANGKRFLRVRLAKP